VYRKKNRRHKGNNVLLRKPFEKEIDEEAINQMEKNIYNVIGHGIQFKEEIFPCVRNEDKRMIVGHEKSCHHLFQVVQRHLLYKLVTQNVSAVVPDKAVFQTGVIGDAGDNDHEANPEHNFPVLADYALISSVHINQE
jgi:hypothetical protein